MPKPAKTKNGPTRPEAPGKISNGAIAGPSTVPSPKLEATSASALVR